MPTAAFHSHYWAVQAPEVPLGPGASAGGGYVTWQAVITACQLFLILFLRGPHGYA